MPAGASDEGETQNGNALNVEAELRFVDSATSDRLLAGLMGRATTPSRIFWVALALVASSVAASCQCSQRLTKAEGLVVSPPSLDFGEVEVGSQSIKTLTLTNQGAAPVALTSATLSDQTNFEVVDFASTSVAVGSTTQLQVKFVPSVVGTFAGILSLNTDAPGSPTLVQVTGIGIPPGTGPGEDGGSAPDAGSSTPDAGSPPPDAGHAGCADGTREGFVDQSRYPQIAGCSGAWSVPGLGMTAAGIQPSCDRQGGNHSVHADGNGCSALDLCAQGWHICQGFQEVQAKAGSCADAVPAETQAPGLFFAVAQHSCTNGVCDSASDTCSISGVSPTVADNDNDVFGCSGASGTSANLGAGLPSGSGCAPLNVTFACEQPGSLCWNQAMPSIGPWQATGSNSYNESDFVTKNGCQGNSCSYSGNSLGPSDEGGVLCCAD
jgi:hypothetical protein